MTDWKAKAEHLKFNEDKSWTEVAVSLQEYFPGLPLERVRDRVRYHLRQSERYHATAPTQTDLTEAAKKLLLKGTTREQLAKALNLSPRLTDAMIEDIKAAGMNVLETADEIRISTVLIPSENVVRQDWSGDRIIRFGLMGDTQINSKYTQITHLHKLYDFYKSEGITQVYHTGDIDEGEEMRPGHKYECYKQGADDHIDEIVRVYPEREGITTSFITGNHDHSFIKRAGLDIGYRIAEQRPDMKYLGQSNALIYLTDNCTLELRHPLDGTAYALSYKPQKMIEAMSGGEKPNILAIGHYHKGEYLFYRNVHCVQTGTTQAQTPWMRGKSIAAHIGGWIIEVCVCDDGTIDRFKAEFIPFYKAIRDDYLNWS